MTQSNDSYRGLGWAHGALTVQRLGAMMAPVTFVLKNGRQVSPMHIAPWGEENRQDLPGIVRKLRGDWPCVPFGYSVVLDDATPEWKPFIGKAPPGEEIHGYSSNYEWDWIEAPEGSLALGIDYPAGDSVRRVERIVTPDPEGPAVDLTFRIFIREACRLPIGLHPVFRLPAHAEAGRLEPAPFDHGRTYAGTTEPAAPFFAKDARFEDLSAVPLRDGTTFDATRMPFARDAEELVQLNGIEGSCALANPEEGYRVRLSWQKEHFPSLLLWISNRGRKFDPWNGRHVALGIEPLCSPYGLSPAAALADNPIARSGVPTARSFEAGEVFTTRYRIEAEAL